MVLPLAASDDPIAVPPAGAPRLEFYVQSERPEALDGDRTVRTLDMIDLAPLGAPRSGQVAALAVGVTAPLDLPGPQIESLAHDTMVRIADDFGFTAEGFYRLVDAAYERRALEVSSNLHPDGFELMPKTPGH